MATSDHTPDEQLVEEAQLSALGDHSAFERLVARYQGRVLANCRFLTRSDEDAEDLAQEVFVKAFFGLKQLKTRSKFASWIQRIKVNHCLNHIRKRKGKLFVELDSPAAQSSEDLAVKTGGGSDINQRFRQNQVRELLSSMSDTLRIPLVLCDMDGLSYQEAANELGIGISALKMRLKRAREYFRARYEKNASTVPDAPGRTDNDE
ncbi:MAG: RNA polymerase sigma factor [Candidatus Krumholzibacteria bacterium]|nr:RNA polymerase sigma factor [Candidatus Krumholzibacteria bacterium]